MAFWVEGSVATGPGGPPRRVTWDNGGLSGDAEAVQAAIDLAHSKWGQVVGPVGGPVTTHNHLASGLSALCILSELFGGEVELGGDVPVRPGIPRGAET